MFTPLHLIFYAFAVVAIVSALAVITTRNPVRSVLSLVVTFFAMSGVWMMLHAEFLSLILILVYVGAVMTLFLFVVMMLNIDRETKESGFVRRLLVGVFAVLVITGLVIFVFELPQESALHLPAPVSEAEGYSNTQALGTLLFTQYVYPFEIAGVLLLAAIIAAITLAHRRPKRRKIQYPSEQISVQPSDRVRLVKMPSEGK